MSKYPANPSKASNESSDDYSNRQKLWTNAQNRERESLNKQAEGIFNELKDLLAEIDAAAGGLDFALKYEYIPTSAIAINNMGIKDFSIDAEVSNSRVKFYYSNAKLSYGSVSRNEVEQNQENVHGVLKIWDTPNENGKFASIYDIAFFYDETPLKILSKGSFNMSEATSTSRSNEKDLNNRVAKQPGKAEWDRKDETATLKTLRTGEFPDPYAVKKQAPKPQPKPQPVEEEEATYDEDEDEEEIEEEVAAQEKYDYSRYGATGNATQIFGNTDEYLFWTGMVFLAGAIGTGVVGFLQNRKYIEANDAVKSTNEKIENVRSTINIDCSDSDGNIDANCVRIATWYAEQPPNEKDEEGSFTNAVNEGRAFYILNKYLATNQKTRDSFNQSRITFFGAAGLSAVISIILFAW
jgi:hypothetical protein